MNAVMPSTGNLYLVVGYDGSAPATRALDAAVRLLHGRTGSIEVVYVAHLTTAEMMSADAIAEMEASFAEIAPELQARPVSSCAAARSAGSSSTTRAGSPTC